MPNLAAWFPYLLFLACPVSMGLMMWWMMRMQPRANGNAKQVDERIAELEREIEFLRARRTGPRSEDQQAAS